ncbi:protein-tyrosine phosphatase-like protein [Phycomyces blakesleeanus]
MKKMQPTLTTSTPLSLASTKRPLSLALPASSSAAPSGSGLANRRRNNKNLSLCLSSSSSAQMFADLASPTFARPEATSQSSNPYQNGPAFIMPFLYLGAESNAADLTQLRKYHIQCLLNLAAEVHNPHEHLFRPLDEALTKSSTKSSLQASKSSKLSLSQASKSSLSIQKMNLNKDDEPKMSYKKMPWQHHQANLATELEVALEAIDRARETGQSILVHCQCGVARSATVIVAYVIKTLRLPLQEAYDYVKARAPAISPNLGLLYQLREFEQKTLRPQNQTYSVPPTPTTPTHLITPTRRSTTNSSANLPISNLPTLSPKQKTFSTTAVSNVNTTVNANVNTNVPSRLSSLSFAWKRKSIISPQQQTFPHSQLSPPESKKSASLLASETSVESWWRLKQSPKAAEPDVSTCC